LKDKDPKYLGIPNICFSIVSKDDRRDSEFKNQRIQRGFDDSETWCLTSTIAQFILPRLKRYEEIADEILLRDVQLTDDIKSFIKAMELVNKDGSGGILTKEEEIEMISGIEKFPKIFRTLWW
jgi:hypothetical protein